MNILFVTVGTSAIYNAEIGRAPDGRDNRALRADVEQYRKSADKRPARFSGLRERLEQAHKHHWNGPHRGSKKHLLETSAELASTVAVFDAVGRRIDRVALLNSATDPGRLAADVNRTVLEPLVAPAQVVLEEVEGLEARVMDTLKPLRKIVDRQCPIGDERVIVNFTGGFKGAIPCITILARRHGWKMFYLHETLHEPVWIQFQKDGSDEMVESSNP